MLKPYLKHLWSVAEELNRENIVQLIEPMHSSDTETHLLDLGCDDGQWTLKLSDRMGATKVSGVEVVAEQAQKAREGGIAVYNCDLNAVLPLPSDAFDVIHANQVIEHVAFIDLFVSEVFRMLKPGGYAIISTENGSSWHNVFAAAMGWQIFSLTNVSARMAGLGNPLAMHRGECFTESWTESWTHKTIFNYQGLVDLFQVHGFQNVKIVGSGYHPLPAKLGRWDVRHSHFITVRAEK